MGSKENFASRYRVVPGAVVDLNRRDAAANGSVDKGEAAKRLEVCRARMRDLQEQLYAEGRRSVLVCVQGTDTAGKDGVINHVFSAINPMGCHVTSFKVPTPTERAHDFLWRHHLATPEVGMFAFHNRSHYEAVVTERVLGFVDAETAKLRCADINAFEAMLSRAGTIVLKFFLHISKDEQLARLKARLDDPLKYWKVSQSDFDGRASWDATMAAYEAALTQTSTDNAPWFIVPSDYKWFRDLAIAEIMVETMEALAIAKPQPPANIEELMERCRTEMKAQKNGVKQEKAEAKSKKG